jgi:hypothetical protein
MTTEEHNKYLAYAHYGFAAVQLLMGLLMMLFTVMIFGVLVFNAPRGEFPAGLVGVILVFAFLLQLLFMLPSVIAGFGLSKRKPWAKAAAVIAGIFSAMSFPLGTALTVYTFWFLFGAGGRELYAGRVGEGRDALLNEAAGANVWAGREAESAPPKEMPNWRD